MMKVLIFGALIIIGVASDEKSSKIPKHETSDDFEPRESYTPYHYLPLQDQYKLNNKYDSHNIVNQRNIYPGQYQKHYTEDLSKHTGYQLQDNVYDDLSLLRHGFLAHNSYRNAKFDTNHISNGYRYVPSLPKTDYNPYSTRVLNHDHLNNNYVRYLVDIGKEHTLPRNYGYFQDNINNPGSSYNGYPTRGARFQHNTYPAQHTPISNPYYYQKIGDYVHQHRNIPHDDINLKHIHNTDGHLASPKHNTYNTYLGPIVYPKPLHSDLAHDSYPQQGYRHFKDVAVTVKNLLYPKNIYDETYHTTPHTRHYGKLTYDYFKDSVGVLKPYKEKPTPYVLPEYRRYNSDDDASKRYHYNYNMY